jgi:hypothetical protein
VHVVVSLPLRVAKGFPGLKNHSCGPIGFETTKGLEGLKNRPCGLVGCEAQFDYMTANPRPKRHLAILLGVDHYDLLVG